MTQTTVSTPRVIAPWVFTWLIAPFGMLGGFLGVTLAYQLGQAQVSTEAIAGLIAVSYVPQTWKFLWAPVVDLTWTRRGWYFAALLTMVVGLLAMGWFGSDGRSLGVLTVFVVAANFASTVIGMAVESLMAHSTPDEQKGRAAGWFQAGNLGGGGIGGGLALWLIQDRGLSVTASAASLAAICLLCGTPLLRLPEPPPEAAHAQLHYRAHLRTLWSDLWGLVRSRGGALGMFICFLPMCTGAAANLWSPLAVEWQATANTVAFVNGAMGGVISALGCMVGGYFCDRMDRKLAYCLYGLLLAAVAVGMALAPRTELAFIVATSVYAFVVGLTYAGFSGLVLEAIGRGAAATKYSLLASLANMPIALMTFVNGWSHERWGSAAMLYGEAAAGVAAVLLFLAVARLSRGGVVPKPVSV
jgi:MFS family permease